MDHPIIGVFILVFVGYVAEYLLRELQHRGILPKPKGSVDEGMPFFHFRVRLVERGSNGDKHGRGGNRRQDDDKGGSPPESVRFSRVPVEGDTVPFASKKARVVEVELLGGDDCIDPWCAVVTVETEWSAGRKAVAS